MTIQKDIWLLFKMELLWLGHEWLPKYKFE